MMEGPNSKDFGRKLVEAAEKKAGRMPDGWEYRLPTEAEWEYACRAGTTTRFHFGDDATDLHRFANYAEYSLHSDDDSFHYCDTRGDDGMGKRPAPIGSYLPNPWGLHDMHGNVTEFVLDVYRPTLPGGTDPIGALKKGEKGGGTIVYRGGAWCSLPEYCQSGFRHHTRHSHNDGHASYRGLRLVLAKSK